MNQIESTVEAMRGAIARYDLLKHPFYQAWSAGTLPTDALATYAREYGAFISALDRGWDALGEPAYAAEERHHVVLWGEFARALDAAVTATPSVGAVKALVDESSRSFAAAPEASGALYAFELQQPATAKSKLEGLDTHYSSLSPAVRPYFDEHARETDEVALIEQKLAQMSDAEQSRAVAACERMSKALWDALSGIYSQPC